MIFVTADSNRAQLECLTKQLVSVFPGSTVYQHANPLHVPRDILHNRVTAAFLEAEMDEVSGIDLMRMICAQKPDVPFFILAQTENFRDAAMAAGAAGYLIHPVGDPELRDAIESVGNQENV